MADEKKKTIYIITFFGRIQLGRYKYTHVYYNILQFNLSTILVQSEKTFTIFCPDIILCGFNQLSLIYDFLQRWCLYNITIIYISLYSHIIITLRCYGFQKEKKNPPVEFIAYFNILSETYIHIRVGNIYPCIIQHTHT